MSTYIDCPFCGAPNLGTARFCALCGEPVRIPLSGQLPTRRGEARAAPVSWRARQKQAWAERLEAGLALAAAGGVWLAAYWLTPGAGRLARLGEALNRLGGPFGFIGGLGALGLAGWLAGRLARRGLAALAGFVWDFFEG